MKLYGKILKHYDALTVPNFYYRVAIQQVRNYVSVTRGVLEMLNF